jgi:hypothetical protein
MDSAVVGLAHQVSFLHHGLCGGTVSHRISVDAVFGLRQTSPLENVIGVPNFV